MSRRSALSWISPALDPTSPIVRLTSGAIQTANRDITASFPLPYDGPTCYVRERDFGKIIKNTPDDPGGVSYREKDGKIVIKSGRSRSQLSTLNESLWPVAPWDDYPDALEPIPDGVIGCIRELRPFVQKRGGDVPWMECLCFTGGYGWATNRSIIARKATAFTGSLLLPVHILDILTARLGNMSGWALTDNHVFLRWNGGAWLRVTTYTGDVADTLPQLLAKHHATTTFTTFPTSFADDVRADVQTAAKLTDGPVVLDHAGVHVIGSDSATSFAHEAQFPLGDGRQRVVLHKDVLNLVLPIIDTWDTRHVPIPWSSTATRGVEGLLTTMVDQYAIAQTLSSVSDDDEDDLSF